MIRGTEFSDRTALAPNLAKILLAAERKGGKISIRDAQLSFTPKFRPSAQIARSWFGELVALNHGVVKKFGKSLIFEITATAKSTDHLSTIAPNPVSAHVSLSTTTDLPTISCLQSPSTTVDTVDEVIRVRLQSEPIQGEDFRSIVDNDHFDHPSEKIENENVADCVNFIRTAILENDSQMAKDKTAPKLYFEFGSRFLNKFLLVLILTFWAVQVVTR